MSGFRTHPAWSAALPALLAAAAILSACAGARGIPDPTAKHLEYAEKEGYPATTLRALSHGRRLYINRCSSCHDLHRPSAFSAKEWPQIVLDMRENAEINEDQARDITRYLVAMAAAQEDAGQETQAPAP